MEELLAARLMMAISLGFHIVFASIGMAMPFFMLVSHYRYLKTNDSLDLKLTKLWSRGVAILFATGAVSGTVLSFELGLLWPRFMEKAGPIFGMPFSWEGTAFFLEAIALGIFLYGWDRLNPRLHWLSGLAVGVSGFVSGVFVLSANAWMNAPQGFDWNNGKPTSIDPVAAMFNPAWLQQSVHMQLAAFTATGFAVAGIHAFYLSRGINIKLNRRALKIALSFGAASALLMPLSGHYSAQWVAKNQPVKLAAMEALYKTQHRAPLLIGGIPDDESETVGWGIELPGALSFLAFNDFDAKVQGLEEVPVAERPPVLITHLAFQVMVGIGSLLAFLALWSLSKLLRKREFGSLLLNILMVATPLGFIAIEAGWVVTEVGRQPWIIYGYLKTKDSVTQVPGMQYHLLLFTAIYLFLAYMCYFLMKRMIQTANKETMS